ncbi:MAG: HEAT repeat domain-containing protein [Planctomycetes bacterium]|nr:HEAT repeat domain-containing protein [Planctomycetota bacterium]
MNFRPLRFSVVALVLCACASDPSGFVPDLSYRHGAIDRILAAEDARDPADPVLLESLKHEDPVLRRFAVRALGRIGDADGIGRLARLAERDPDLDVRLEAVRAIGLCAHPKVVDAVDPYLTAQEPRLRVAAARALGLSRDERALGPLLSVLADNDADVRGTAALGIARLALAREDRLFGRSVGRFLVLADRMTNDIDAAVRWRATYAAGVLAQPEFKASLLTASADADPTVRAFACVGLAALEPDDASRARLIAALSDASWCVAVEAAKALGKDASPETLSALARVVGGSGSAGHPSFHVRAAAVEALRGFASVPGAVDVVRGAFTDPAESVRSRALEPFALLAPPEAAIETFLATLEGRSSLPPTIYVRARLAAAAAAIAEQRGIDVVEALLDDPDIAVRTAAIAATARLTSSASRFVTPLRAALAENDVALRESAAVAAEALGLVELAPDITRAIEQSTGAEFVEARLAGLKALAALAGNAALPALRAALTDPELAVRQGASDAIAKLGGEIPRVPPREAPLRAATPRAGVDFLGSDARPRVTLTSNKGVFELELLVDDAPTHCAIFLERVRAGFYDGLSFHRMEPGFVIQGLDPRGDGYGTGGRSLRDELNAERYERGTVGMPNAGADTGGCQIFVTFRPQPRLDDRYTIFARVVSGMDVFESLDVGDRVDTAR